MNLKLNEKAFGLILCVTFSLFFGFVSKASHVAGGEISYTCLGPNQYRITLTTYRDCNGISSSSSEVVNYTSVSCGVNASITLNLQSIVDITPLCPSASSACGGGGTFGIEKLVYTGIVTLPPGCNDWVFSFDVCCRNGAITNLSSPDGTDFYTQTTLNNTLTPCNNSPVFADNPQLFACVGQTINYQQLATDPDGDVLVYSLVNAMDGAGSNAAYNGGFSGANPFTVPAVIDAATGEITFTPDVTQVAVVAVLVQEYRGGVLIGSVMRDIQFNIVNCINTIPAISGINGVPGVYSISACAGAPICFTVNATDVDAGQTVTMSSSNSIPGSSLTQSGSGTSITGTFCWTPSVSDIGTHYITINADDNTCPLIGQNSQTYEIIVIANPHPAVSAGADVTICEGSSTVLNGVVGLTPPTTTYSWTPSASLATPTSTSTNATPASTTAYTFTVTYADGCISTDAVTVNVAADPVAFISPTSATVCASANFMLTGTTDVTGMNYQWFNPSMVSLGSGAFVGTQNSLIVTVPAAPGSYVYTFRVTNPVTGCFTTATSTLIVGSPPALASCVNIYATTTGLAGNPGTQAAPTSLANALAMAACNNAVIKLATGTYNITNALNLSSYVTIEGGFTAGTWVKSSAPGATVINRTVANPEGAANAERIVAFYGNSITGFRLQDITITTANGTAGSGMSTYGIHLTNCSNYNIVRTQVLPGAAGSGAGDDNPATINPTWDGANGGNGVNGITGNGPQCTCGGDNGGTGSNGGGAGTGGANAIAIGGNAGTGAAGGRGGDGRPDSSGGAGFNGNPGNAAAAGGGGGAAGTGGAQDGNGNSTSNVGNGGAGGVGTAGTNGTTNASAHVAGFWLPGTGTNGTSGTGGGGAGGGGGAARDTDLCDAAGGGGSGGGGGGGGGGAGRGAFGGGSSFGIYLFNNAAGGNLIQDRIVAGAAGAAGLGGRGGIGGNGGTSAIGNGCTNGDSDGNRGGNGGTGGIGGAGGNGGNGPAGVSINVHLNGGSALVTNVNNFNLAAQPVVTVTNVNCTNTNVTYTSAVLGAWDFDLTTNNAVPATAAAVSPAITQYSTIARYSISVGANQYTGFHNISFDGSVGSQIATNAPQIGVDTYQICQGDFASFSSVYPASIYQWNFNGAAANPGNFQNTNTQFNTPGVYTISLQVITDCCGLSPAKDVLLYVVRNPTATGSGNVAICNGSSTTLTLAGLVASDVVTWSPLTAITGSTANTITVNPTATTTYIATITGSLTNGGTTVYGCPRTVLFTVTVNQIPVLNFTNTPASCSNNGMTTATSSLPGAYNFVWSNGGMTFGANSSTINSLSTGNYTVTATSVTNGCQATGSTMIFPSGSQPVAYVQSNTPTCATPTSGSAILSVAGGSPIYTFHTFSNGYPNVNTVATVTLTNLAAGNYTAQVTDAFGCVSPIFFNIPELSQPTYTITDNSGICAGNDAIYSVSGSDGAVLTYDLGAGSTTIILDHDPVDIIIPNANTSQIMTLTSIDGNCTIPLFVNIPLVVDPCGLSIELASFNGVCENGDKRFNWVTSSEENNAFFTLEQSENGLNFMPAKTIQGAGNSSVSTYYSTNIPMSSESLVYYRLRQTDFDGNYSFSKIIYVSCTEGEGNVLYPNPATIQLNLQLENKSAGAYSIEIYDLLGKRVKTFNYSKEVGADINMTISELVNGNYLLKARNLTTNEELATMKFVVLK